MALDDGWDTQMNVFEDLVVELKEENLLEDTVIEHGSRSMNGAPLSVVANGSLTSNGNKRSIKPSTAFARESFQPVSNSKQEKEQLSLQLSALQLIELVIAASEAVDGNDNNSFDDLPAKKAFHRYDQALTDKDSEEYLEAKSEVLSCLGNWQDDLSKRDAKIAPSSLRKYIESANPPLSPQALFAMLRFYRGIPVSEWSYAKFDLIVTRLFSKFVDEEKREPLCSQSEIVKHLTARYADWGMDGFKSLPADDPEVAMLALKFDDFRQEAERASDLKELISSQLFDRLLAHKRSTGALFFIPKITAAAVESNLKIASRMVDLMAKEKERGGAARLGDLNGAVVSDAIARTVDVGGEQANDTPDGRSTDLNNSPRKTKSLRAERPVKAKDRSKKQKVSRGNSLLGVNRWLLAATVLSVIFSVGIYVWAEYFTTDTVVNNSVKSTQFDDPELKQIIGNAKISGSILYAVANPEFVNMKEDQQREFLKKLQQAGVVKGYDRVSLMNGQGKTIAYASKDRIELKDH